MDEGMAAIFATAVVAENALLGRLTFNDSLGKKYLRTLTVRRKETCFFTVPFSI